MIRLFSIVAGVCAKLSKDEVAAHYTTLYGFFCQAFMIRGSTPSIGLSKDITRVEESIVDACVAFILRLNDKQLNEFIRSMLQWFARAAFFL